MYLCTNNANISLSLLDTRIPPKNIFFWKKRKIELNANSSNYTLFIIPLKKMRLGSFLRICRRVATYVCLFLSAQTKNANYPLDCSSRLTLFSAYLKNDTTTVGVDAWKCEAALKRGSRSFKEKKYTIFDACCSNTSSSLLHLVKVTHKRISFLGEHHKRGLNCWKVPNISAKSWIQLENTSPKRTLQCCHCALLRHKVKR